MNVTKSLLGKKSQTQTPFKFAGRISLIIKTNCELHYLIVILLHPRRDLIEPIYPEELQRGKSETTWQRKVDVVRGYLPLA